jgi:hypothetical protein
VLRGSSATGSAAAEDHPRQCRPARTKPARPLRPARPQLRRPVDGGVLYGTTSPGLCNEATLNNDMTGGGLGLPGIDMYIYVTADMATTTCSAGTLQVGVDAIGPQKWKRCVLVLHVASGAG